MISPTTASPCQSCGALIFMVAHARTGKAAPINVGPDPAGNIRLELTNSGWRYHVITAKDTIYTPPEERFTSHFATCPAAARYRREPPRRLAGSEIVEATVRAAYPDNVIPFPARKTSQTEGERR